MRDISKLISAVKPRSRTDQYKILSALYCLHADTKPASVAEISSLIKLHFGKNPPKNINASLVNYVPNVRAEHGTPRRWALSKRPTNTVLTKRSRFAQSLVALWIQSPSRVMATVSRALAIRMAPLPNPAFKRTRTGGAGLWVFLASRAPVRAA